MMQLNITKVLISDKVDTSCKDILEKHGISVTYKPGMSKDDLKSIIPEFDALIVRSATKVTPDVFECAKHLKLVGRAGTGVDNIDLNAASKHGVLVMNTPGGNTLSAAEHTCAMISAVSRNIGQAHASMQEGKWERSKFMGFELMGKTLAIIGLGRIGREVAHRMQSYGVKTIGYDPLVPAEDAASFGVEWLQLEQIWPIADFITVHVPLIPPTKGMINTKVFEICKPTVKLVNVARGGIIDESDLLVALNSGKCGGAALDVFVTEPPKDVSLELVKHPKVLATPHLGASTIEAQVRVAQEIAEQIVDAANGKSIFGLVNAPALAESSNPLYQAWMNLCEKLGKLTACHKGLNPVTVEIKGDSLASSGKLFGVAFSHGYAKIIDSSSNLINCSLVLKEAGIQVLTTHVKGETTPKVSVLKDKQVLFSGIVSDDKPALTSFNGVQLVTAISLADNLVTAEGLNVSDLLPLYSDMNVTSLSTGVNCNKSVVVATVTKHAGQGVKEPLKFVQL